MSILWKWVDKKEISNNAKSRLFLILNSLMCSVIGFLIWIIVSRFALNTWDWAICFIGYSGFFIGYIGGFIFLCQR